MDTQIGGFPGLCWYGNEHHQKRWRKRYGGESMAVEKMKSRFLDDTQISCSLPPLSFESNAEGINAHFT